MKVGLEVGSEKGGELKAVAAHVGGRLTVAKVKAGVSTPIAGAATPERRVEAYYLQRTRFESIAERKPRRRRLTEDGNVEISGRDLREGGPSAPVNARPWR